MTLVYPTPNGANVIQDWPQFLAAGVLVMVRISGLFVFAPIFNSAAIPTRVKAGLAFAITILLAPAVASVPDAHAMLDVGALLGELGVGLVFGLSLSLLNESLMFAGTMLGMEFSFSLVNLLDPNTRIETPVLGQMLDWLGILVIVGAGLDRTLLAAVVRSFVVVPVGRGVIEAATGVAMVRMGGGIFLAGMQLASPVIAAALSVEVTIGLIGKLAPQLPTQVVGIPVKTLISYGVLIGSLAVWPGWIERHFTSLLDAAGRMLVRA
ncbi:flagellar biosynthetic protein FliR [Granulicella sibirica]|uniref:Flagellar biosynthesis protein FliR n=1 Tax=Granulicella sibirica TaxID=2479048 RepID=A0A4Q0T4U3_9BACT|nr:flagellar biosynthetic protein FliR [Granulicella sibirica]RXH56606.1 Flagellar biosynthesis protein FliR [Granulicella sibirica]